MYNSVASPPRNLYLASLTIGQPTVNERTMPPALHSIWTTSIDRSSGMAFVNVRAKPRPAPLAETIHREAFFARVGTQ